MEKYRKLKKKTEKNRRADRGEVRMLRKKDGSKNSREKRKISSYDGILYRK